MTPEIWATSDQHFGHVNILKYSKRPFSSVEEMDEAIIANYNSVVKPQDVVYHLGDFAFYQATKISHILSRLNGNKTFIYGNHDKQIRQSKETQAKFSNCVEVAEVKVDNTLVCMSHYAHLVWNKSHHGSIMLHGHSHGSLKYPFTGRIMDVGVDPQNFFPVNVREVIKNLSNISIENF